MRDLIGFYFSAKSIQYFRLKGDLTPAIQAVDGFTDGWDEVIDEYESRCNVIDQFSANADAELISMEIDSMGKKDRAEFVEAVRQFLENLNIQMVVETPPEWSKF